MTWSTFWENCAIIHLVVLVRLTKKPRIKSLFLLNKTADSRDIWQCSFKAWYRNEAVSQWMQTLVRAAVTSKAFVQNLEWI